MSHSLVVLQDGPLWVLNKPAGVVVHPGDDPHAVDLMQLAVRAGAPPGIAPIHRIDLETSGIVLASPDAALRGELGELFARGQMVKRYRALVQGRCRKKGVVHRALQDARRGRPVTATTRYRTHEWLGPFSLLSVRPDSGRKHQIRRHLQGLGHAIVGDERYPPERLLIVPGFPGRLWLHAASLELPDGRWFEAPLPPELDEHLALLRSMSSAV